jgi:two-component system phosphate regulon sensor histidine kinase PhoR
MESGRRTYEFAAHDVKSIVEESIAAFEPTRERRDVELTVSVSPDLPAARCDKAALVDCLVNLLSNAYKYGGNPRLIEISAAARPKFVAITVRDNGKGIARKEHKRIFEKFYRVDDLLSRQQEGSGLGLSIVRHVVKAHRGKIFVDSEPGRGCSFTLMLPQVSAPTARADAPMKAEKPTSRPEEGRATEVAVRESMEG